MPRITKEERLLDVWQVANLLGVSESMVYKLKDSGQIEFVSVGSRILFAPADVNAYVASRRTKKTPQTEATA